MKTKKSIKNIKENNKVVLAVRAARTSWRAGQVLVPAAASAYLLINFNDIIVTGLAVLIAFYSLSSLVKVAWLAERS